MQNYLQVIQPLDMRLMHGARRAQPGDTTTEEPFGRETSSSSFPLCSVFPPESVWWGTRLTLALYCCAAPVLPHIPEGRLEI